MNAELHFTATIQPGNRVEIPTDQFAVGQVVEVIVKQQTDDLRKQPVLDFILKNRGPLRSYPSWEEMEREFQAERDAWDQ